MGAIAIVLSLGIVAYGAYLVLLGPTLQGVVEGTATAFATRNPTPSGLIPAFGGALSAGGVLSRRLRIAWTGTAISALFAVLFVFGNGGVLIPMTLALVVAMIALAFAEARESGPRG